METAKKFNLAMRHNFNNLDMNGDAIRVGTLLKHLRGEKHKYYEDTPDSDHSLDSPRSLLAFYMEQSHYQRPKPRVEYIPLQNGDVLFIRAISGGWSVNSVIEP